MTSSARMFVSFALTATLSLTLASCGDELAVASEIRGFRVFGARIENLSRASTMRAAEAAPGERVRVTLAYTDPIAMTRPITFVWVFCPQTARMGNALGCAPTSAVPLMGSSVEYEIPRNIEYSIDPTGRARIQGVMLACAGGTLGFNPMTMLPTCTGAGAESVTMIRSIRVRTTETDPVNRNPELRAVALHIAGRPSDEFVTLDAMAPVRVPRCASDPCPEHTFEARVTDESRETYSTLDNTGAPITQPERLQFGFFSTGGKMDLSFRVDTAERPMGPIRNTWTAPRTPGTHVLFVSAQDVRGGFDWLERRVIVE